jgi:hypothetical protein
MLARELEEGVQVETLLSITAHTLSRRERETGKQDMMQPQEGC